MPARFCVGLHVAPPPHLDGFQFSLKKKRILHRNILAQNQGLVAKSWNEVSKKTASDKVYVTYKHTS